MTGQSDNASRGNGATSVLAEASPDAATAIAPAAPDKAPPRKTPRRPAREDAGPKTTESAGAEPAVRHDRRPPELYLNRELTWLAFNRRVLHEAKDDMLSHTDIKQAPWHVVEADVKKRARLNCIRHLLSLIPYEDMTPEPVELPKRKDVADYIRPPKSDQNFVPDYYQEG